MRLRTALLALLVLFAARPSTAVESWIQLPADSNGKRLRAFNNTISGTSVYTQAFFLSDTTGVEKALVASPIFVQFSDGAASYIGAKTGQLPSALVGARLDVNLGGVAGTATVNGGAAGTLAIGGTQASNAAITANPVLIGGEAAASGSSPTVATAGRIRQGTVDLQGTLYVREGGPNTWSCSLAAVGTSLTQCQAAPAAGLRLYVTDVLVQVTTATAATWQLKSGTGSNCGTGTANVMGWAAVAPISTSTPQDINMHSPFALAAATQLCVVGSSGTNTINIQINGYTAP